MSTDRGRICDAITAWRDGATLDARHPLEGDDADATFLWDPNAVKDLARVIARTLRGERLEYRELPWSGAPEMQWQPPPQAR